MNIQELVEHIKRSSQHNYVYHFTDESNLDSIGATGLLSKRQLALQKVAAKRPGGNQWSWDADERKGLTDYVNLCLTTNHPMCKTAMADGRISNPKYIAIDPSILLSTGVKITFDVANKSGVAVHQLQNEIPNMDLEVLYSRTDWKQAAIRDRLKAVEKYEILVPSSIARKHLLYLM